MRTGYRIALASALLAASASASAASPLLFSYAEVDYLRGETADGVADTDGYRFALSREMSSRSFWLLDYDNRKLADAGADDSYVSFLSAGLGFKSNTRRVPNFAVFGTATYERFDQKQDPAGPADTRFTNEGYGLQLGLRGWAFETFEVNASYKFMDLGDGEQDAEVDLIRAGVAVPLNRNLALTANFQRYADRNSDAENDEYLLGLRFRLADSGKRRRR